MGVYGFGGFKEKFSKEYDGLLGNLVVAFDITHLIVLCLQNTNDVKNFITIFRNRFFLSAEYTFIRQYRPLELFVIVDNKSPCAKRQTQKKRILKKTSIIERINFSKKPVCEKRLTLLDVRDSVESFFLKEAFSQAFLNSTKIHFNIDEGEGELKAINVLMNTKHEDSLRVVMSRDNDVFIYLLGLRDRWFNLDRYLIFYETNRSFLLLRCWQNIPVGYAWVLVLWFGVCYGNDYTFGLFEKNVNVLSGKFSELICYFFFCIHQNMIPCYDKNDKFFFRDNIFKSFQLLVSFMRGRTYNVTIEKENDVNVKTWLKRQIWSFAYAIELPAKFLNDEYFHHFPKIRINAEFDKPYLPLKRLLAHSNQELENFIVEIIDEGF